MKKILLPLSLLIGLALSTAQAAVVFSDNFSDGTVDAWASTAPSGDTNSGALSVVDATSLGLDGNALSITTDTTSGPGQQGPAYALGSTYTLANTGDSISLSFNFVADVVVSNTGFFRFGLVSDSGDLTTLDGAEGYFGQISSSTTQRGRIAQTNDLYYADGFNNVQNDSDWQIAADTAYSASLTLTRTVAGVTADLTWSGGGGNSLTVTQADFDSPDASGGSIPSGTSYTTFDTIVFGINADAATVLYDDVEVSFVPEPSTFALFGLAGLAVLMVSRRRR